MGSGGLTCAPVGSGWLRCAQVRSATRSEARCVQTGSEFKPAEISQAERSEVPPREARPPPKAAGAEGAFRRRRPRASRGLQTKARGDQARSEEAPAESNADSSFPGSSAPPSQVYGIKNVPNGSPRRMFLMDCNARTCTGVAFGVP